jgi:hypothetical protein
MNLTQYEKATPIVDEIKEIKSQVEKISSYIPLMKKSPPNESRLVLDHRDLLLPGIDWTLSLSAHKEHLIERLNQLEQKLEAI